MYEEINSINVLKKTLPVVLA